MFSSNDVQTLHVISKTRQFEKTWKEILDKVLELRLLHYKQHFTQIYSERKLWITRLIE